MAWLRSTNLVLSALTVLAPIAHILELPNKLVLDGELWLAVQQHLYQGWGPYIGGPTEFGALVTSLILAYVRRRSGNVAWPTLVAAGCYLGMHTVFFILNAPVNTAVASWIATTLPPNWASWRLRWEVGHAISALLAVIGLAALLWAGAKESRAAANRRPGEGAALA